MNLKHNVFCTTIDVAIHDSDIRVIKDSNLKLFRIKLSSYEALVDDLIPFLLPDEIQRADRYHSIKDRNRFIICRALLKLILSIKTGLKINDIHFKKDENKKPHLISDRSIHFNVSHSEDYAIIAVANHQIGVDVEFISRNFEYQDILSHVFSDFEINTVLSAKNSKNTFYKLWTRKEAFVKATGDGITDSLKNIPAIDGHHSLTQNLLGEFENLNVMGFYLDDNYAGALAFGGEYLYKDEIIIYNLPTSIDRILLFLQS